MVNFLYTKIIADETKRKATTKILKKVAITSPSGLNTNSTIESNFTLYLVFMTKRA